VTQLSYGTKGSPGKQRGHRKHCEGLVAPQKRVILGEKKMMRLRVEMEVMATVLPS